MDQAEVPATYGHPLRSLAATRCASFRIVNSSPLRVLRNVRGFDGTKLTVGDSITVCGDALTYRFELEDPEYLAQPITGQLQWAYRPDLEYVSLPCDVGSASQFLNR